MSVTLNDMSQYMTWAIQVEHKFQWNQILYITSPLAIHNPNHNLYVHVQCIPHCLSTEPEPVCTRTVHLAIFEH